jgi:glycosyltransferase involved in cell wall biosynthesis
MKEVESISKLDAVNNIFIAALHSGDLCIEEQINENVILTRFPLKSSKLGKGLIGKVLKYIEFVLHLLFFYKNKNVGMLNIHNLRLLPLGYLLKKIYGAKLIYDTHELETETNGLCGPRKILSKWFEYFFIKKVDHIFVVSENIADWYRDTYKIRRPTVVMNVPRLQHVEKNDYFRGFFGLRKDQVIVLYQGGLVLGRGVELLLKAFDIRKNDKVVIVFMGYGSLENEIQIASRSSSTVFFHQAVAPETLLRYTGSADIGIHFIEKTCLSHYYCMPNKLFEYTMAGLPVIVSDMKEMREFVEENEIGIVIESKTAEAINQAVDILLENDLSIFKGNATKAARANSWELQEEKMLDVYKQLLGVV